MMIVIDGHSVEFVVTRGLKYDLQKYSPSDVLSVENAFGDLVYQCKKCKKVFDDPLFIGGCCQ